MPRILTVLAIALALLVPTPARAANEPPRVLFTDGGDRLSTVDEGGTVPQNAYERFAMESRRWGFDLTGGWDEPHRFDAVVYFDNTGISDDRLQSLRNFAAEGGTVTVVAAGMGDWFQPSDGNGAQSTQSVEYSATSTGALSLWPEDDELDLHGPFSTVFDNLEGTTAVHTVVHEGESLPVSVIANGSRTFGTAGGRTFDSWSDRDFLTMVRYGIAWGTDDSDFVVQAEPDKDATWPYIVLFAGMVAAVGVGGLIAVRRIEKQEDKTVGDGAAAGRPPTGGPTGRAGAEAGGEPGNGAGPNGGTGAG
ncbi:hypothetical protein [Salininema proteolyticum]|uniref:Uncharacterized protein n=1 Tax=Salininema proteolyticum TaxID=1607685 RepID=A0ABV8TT13_9ACTN